MFMVNFTDRHRQPPATLVSQSCYSMGSQRCVYLCWKLNFFAPLLNCFSKPRNLSPVCLVKFTGCELQPPEMLGLQGWYLTCY
jgi:hypothetical protein